MMYKAPYPQSGYYVIYTVNNSWVADILDSRKEVIDTITNDTHDGICKDLYNYYM